MTNNLENQTFGRLTVIRKRKRRRNGAILWQCRCSCNKVIDVTSSHLKAGDTKSCGCLRKETTSLRNYKHGAACRREKDNSDHLQLHYIIWANMKNRCYYKKDINYDNYGGRGIKVCKEWKKDFISFAEYIRTLPNCPKDSLLRSRVKGIRLPVTIDRIDNDGNYEPGNLRWATRKQQNNNSRRNRIETFKGETAPLSQLVEKYAKVPYKIVLQRLSRNNWSIDDALLKPQAYRKS